MCVSSKVSRHRAEGLARIIGVQLVGCHERYLGLPSFVGKSKSQLFTSIRDRIWNRVKGWQNKLFSVGAIPTYAMSLFKLPTGLVKDIHRCCRLVCKPSSLTARVLKQYYFPNCSVMQADNGKTGSYLWNSFIWGMDRLKAGTRWRVGNGESISIYKDQWLPRPSTFKPITPPPLEWLPFGVQLKIKSQRRWKLDNTIKRLDSKEFHGGNSFGAFRFQRM
ncbi:hypothetical protein Dsin_026755 [Dipteronia sinensis]|uniref:Reverse transcriptase n=1 Tax=Dipteronia sinensis TaxID=43782 RepID=A0AAD9ZYH8_9ROSI|nr:hypothetical protein Dsin_026755 [Dipteronia sinensis]